MTTAAAPSTWYTAAELAQLALPGVPSNRQRVDQCADAQRWRSRTGDDGAPLARRRAGRGGGTEYHASLLPEAARLALARRVPGATPPPAPIAAEPDTLWERFDQLGDGAKAKAERALLIVQEIETLLAAGLPKTTAVAQAAKRWSVGTSTIHGWFSAIAGAPIADRLPHLAPRYQGGGKEAEIDQEVWQALRSDFLRPSQPSWESCVRRAATIADLRGVPMPAARTLWRKFEREVPALVTTLHRKGIDALRGHLPPQKRTVADLHALELVNIDGHTCDVRVEFPDGRIGRPVMVAIQDVFSRKFLAWRHAASEDSIAARLCFADLFARYGIPGGLLSDNGRAFACKWLTGGATTRFRFKVRPEEPVGLLTNLGVTIHWALPYRGSSKPIERGFRDFCDAIARHPAFEGAYTGNNALNKPDNYGARAVPWATFIAVWNAGVAEHNARTGRRTETARGRDSFDQVFERSYATAAIRKATNADLRMALLAAEQVRADRKTGAVKLLGNSYWSADLATLAGQLVVVRFDPDDATKPVHVYDAAGRFVATADMWEATGFLDAEAAKRRAKLEADHRKSAKAASAALNLLTADQLAAILPTYEDETPAPEATVVRPVRLRGNVAAALKPAQQAAPDTEPSFIDAFAAGAARKLRVVGE